MKEKDLKESLKKERKEGVVNCTRPSKAESSVSYAAVLSTSVGVKARKRKESSPGKKMKRMKSEQTEEMGN